MEPPTQKKVRLEYKYHMNIIFTVPKDKKEKRKKPCHV